MTVIYPDTYDVITARNRSHLRLPGSESITYPPTFLTGDPWVLTVRDACSVAIALARAVAERVGSQLRNTTISNPSSLAGLMRRITCFAKLLVTQVGDYVPLHTGVPDRVDG